MFMFEKAIVGGRRYWIWILCLVAVIGLGFLAWLRQFDQGLGITGNQFTSVRLINHKNTFDHERPGILVDICP